MRELAGPVLLITASIAALVIYAKIARWAQRKRLSVMAQDVATRRAYADAELALTQHINRAELAKTVRK